MLKTTGTDGHCLQATTWAAWIGRQLTAQGSPYTAFWHGGLEIQIMPAKNDDLLTEFDGVAPFGYQKPFPKRLSPENDAPRDHLISYHPALIGLAGTSWWNYRAKQTEAAFFDFDFGHGPKGLTAEQIAEVDEWAKRLPYVLNATSKSGMGRHWLVRLTKPMRAETRAQHSANCRAVYGKVSVDLGFDIERFTCAAPGAVQYVFVGKSDDSAN